MAVSFLLATLAVGQSPVKLSPIVDSQIQLRQRADQRPREYERLLPSLATLVFEGHSVGIAVLIDTSGLYLASKDSVPSSEVEAVFVDGHTGHVTILSQDNWTQLVLLRSDYVPQGAVSVTPATEAPQGTPLLVILPQGAIQARVTSESRVGRVHPSNHFIPLSELSLELPSASLGSAPVFTADGRFVGLLSAALTSQAQSVTMQNVQNASASAARSAGGFGGGAGPGAGLRFGTNQQLFGAAMGPANLALAYLPSPDAMQLTLSGFNTPDHQVEHPTLGVFCSDGLNGALVREVVPDSPADHIGLKDSDLIIGLGNFLIRNKTDFAKALFKFRVGNKVQVRIDREGRLLLREAVLAKSPD